MKAKFNLIQTGLFALAIASFAGFTMAGPPSVDWGDAPDSYSTVFGSGGANHVLTDGLFLGASVDGEPNGQPNPPATGDDMDLLGPSGGDDEDGVFLTGPLVPGSLASVTVIASLGTGKLDAWMDFNANGTFEHPAEQIFASVPLAAGANFLTFPVPPAAIVTGATYSRWRLSTAGSLSPTGSTSNGEVEDYCHSPIHGQKWHDLNSNGKRDANEPGLNGYVIQLYDQDGTTLIASATTHDFEHDGNLAGIDPFTERGVYWMHAPSGFCIVREQLDTANVVQTFPANCGAKEYFIWVQCEPLGREPKPPDCGPGFNWVDLCTAPGTDEMFSAAQIILESPPGPPFNGEILTMFASGPTFITRSASMNPGPNGFIQTEMVEMNLVGHHPATGRFHARAGSQLLPPPIPGSQGQILENGGDQFVVDSFFDVFFEIEIPDFPIPTLQQMRNDWNGPGAHVETKITQVPPFGAEYIEEDVLLHFPAAFPGPTGALNDFRIIKLIHKPIHGIDFGNKITNAKKKADLRKKCNRLKKKIRKAKKRGQRAKAKRLTRKWNKCKRDLRRL